MLNNLNESIKLWVRIGLDEGFKRSARKKMKMQIRLLLGENIQVLSKFKGVTCEKYKQTVLPKLLKIIISHKDSIA